ncbi:MAG: rRNA maturation RNase YbeY [Pseudomonadota bacterium]
MSDHANAPQVAEPALPIAEDHASSEADDPPQRVSCEIDIRDARWDGVLPELRPVLDAVSATLASDEAAVAERGRSGDFTIALGDDAFLRTLNAEFRDQDKPTNVLSFPAPRPQGHAAPSGNAAPTYLGDVAISFDRTAAEASEAGIAIGDHATHLVVHGLLHLLGFDHETDEDAGTMEGLEVKILDRLGIADPYRSGERSEPAAANPGKETARDPFS